LKQYLKYFIVTFFLGFCYHSAQAQKVNWVSFADLPDSLRKAPKPILVFIHTDWCKYCLLQDHNTFQDSLVAQALNKNYYAIRLNGEETQPISFLNRIYKSRSKGHHELAELLGKEQGELVFPSTVILSEQLQLQQRITGFINTNDLLTLLQ
jgi:uncharacterized protein YyaL (SSP411 family)